MTTLRFERTRVKRGKGGEAAIGATRIPGGLPGSFQRGNGSCGRRAKRMKGGKLCGTLRKGAELAARLKRCASVKRGKKGADVRKTTCSEKTKPPNWVSLDAQRSCPGCGKTDRAKNV